MKLIIDTHTYDIVSNPETGMVEVYEVTGISRVLLTEASTAKLAVSYCDADARARRRN